MAYPFQYRGRRPGVQGASPTDGRRPLAAPTLGACLLLITLAAGIALGEKLQDLKPQGYVNDFGGVLSDDARQKLTALATEVDQKTQAQITVVTVHNLDGDSVEDFANRLGQQWGVGHKTNRGVLILLAVDDHKYRVEVGYGLEGILPDGKVGGFGREMVPALRRNDYSGAVLQLTWSVASVIAQDRGVTLSQTPPPTPPDSGESPSSPPFAGLIVVAALIGFGLLRFFLRNRVAGRRGGGWWWWGGPWIGGGFGRGGFGGGGGGGGFGGFGGGSFGGGGASGSW